MFNSDIASTDFLSNLFTQEEIIEIIKNGGDLEEIQQFILQLNINKEAVMNNLFTGNNSNAANSRQVMYNNIIDYTNMIIDQTGETDPEKIADMVYEGCGGKIPKVTILQTIKNRPTLLHTKKDFYIHKLMQ